MATTYKLIASSTVTASSVADIEFTSIPNTYTDLMILTSIRLNDAGAMSNFRMRFNGSTSSYSNKRIYGTGSGLASDNQPDTGTYFGIGIMPGTGATSSTFGNISIYIPNYASSYNKSISVDAVAENNSATSYQVLSAGLWSNTSAITSIKLLSGDVNILQYSTAYLYGIKNS